MQPNENNQLDIIQSITENKKNFPKTHPFWIAYSSKLKSPEWKV